MGTTPIYGFPYPDPSDLVANYPALGQQLAEDIEDVLPTIGGLAPATPTTIANSGGTATLSGNTVTFTGVTSVSLNSCFTTTYEAYEIVIGVVGSTTLGLRMRLRAAGADISAVNTYRRMDIFQATSATVQGNNELVDQAFLGTTLAYAQSVHTITIYNPLRTDWKSGVGLSMTDDYHHSYGMTFRTATAADGFTLFGSAGTLTGKVRVYGYQS